MEAEQIFTTGLRPRKRAPLVAFSFFTLSKSGCVQFLYSIKKEGDSRIFQAQDRVIDDFTLKGKPRNGSIDKFEFIC